MRRRGRGIERISRRWWFGEQFKLVCGTQLLGYWILTSGGGFPTRQNEIAIIVQLLKLDLPSRETHIENYVKSYFSLTWVSILRLWCQYKHYLVASRDDKICSASKY